ncbi:MAG: HAD family hydrolase [SAR202 cluster bacterium]|nr:HAD family hydrolase [SAR202 cluster bacterium]
MIKAVSFDFYNTLVRFWPPLEEIQQAACHELGLTVHEDDITHGYAVADVFFNRENEERPLSFRSDEERLEFFGRYEQMILETAGISVSMDLARRVWKMAMSVPKDFIPFIDTVPALEQLHEAGYKLGVITNLRRDMDELFQRLGLASHLDFKVSSEEAGIEKPHPDIFRAALKKIGAAPEEVVHVGDQVRSDVMGAKDVGMHAVLIDRSGYSPDTVDCPTIASMSELLELVKGLN